ncbi:MAG: peptidoglycan DD-metalloendopeptidase family protein [Bacteroidales bacterium]|nr:peptidoglycan DD-metalloendopeptidase family protein [Bacteroidales bacterium]
MKRISLYCIFLLITTISFSQKKEELEKQRIKILKEIEIANELLQETKEIKVSTEEKMTILNKKVLLRESLVEKLNFEIIIIENKIEENVNTIASLKKDLENIKSQYARLVYVAYRNRNKENLLIYIFSAKDLNQAYKRIKYIKQYSKYRKEQILMIRSLNEVLNNKVIELEKEKDKKESLMRNKLRERSLLDKEIKEKNKLIENLDVREREIRKEIEDKEKIANKLNLEIRKYITESKKLNYNKLTPQEKVISGDFEKNSGRLPWPTDKGIVTLGYGEQNHPVVKSVKVINNGIDITTSIDSDVRCVFDGRVTKVLTIKGANYTVLIKHGIFLSVYHNLGKVIVKEGDLVKTKQIIGKVYNEPGKNTANLHFEIWKELENLNPQVWLSD